MNPRIILALFGVFLVVAIFTTVGVVIHHAVSSVSDCKYVISEYSRGGQIDSVGNTTCTFKQ